MKFVKKLLDFLNKYNPEYYKCVNDNYLHLESMLGAFPQVVGNSKLKIKVLKNKKTLFELLLKNESIENMVDVEISTLIKNKSKREEFLKKNAEGYSMLKKNAKQVDLDAKKEINEIKGVGEKLKEEAKCIQDLKNRVTPLKANLKAIEKQLEKENFQIDDKNPFYKDKALVKAANFVNLVKKALDNKIKKSDECENLRKAVKEYDEKLVDDCDLLLLKTERTGWHLGKKGEKKSPEEHFNFLSSTDFQELKFLKELPKKIKSMEKEAAKTMGKLHDYFKEFKKTCDEDIKNAFSGAEKHHPIQIADKLYK